MIVKITRQYATKNIHYKNNVEIPVRKLVLHSAGCNQPDPAVFARLWNDPTSIYPAQIVVGTEKAYEVIPCLQKKGKAVMCYHVGTANASSIGVEMTEPASIEYTGGASFKDKDPAKTKAHVLATYANAVDVFAQLCTFHGLDPLEDGVILSHSECYKRGIGTNHGDVEHLWKFHGLTMDGFRKAVKAAMSGGSPMKETAPKETAPKDATIDSVLEVQTWLNNNYAAGLTRDNLYGSKTKAALVKALQKELGFKGKDVDGIFGKKTKAAVKNLRRGDKGILVKVLQGLLVCNGYKGAYVDGDFGVGTESAVEQYQRRMKLDVDGIAGKDTFTALCA